MTSWRSLVNHSSTTIYFVVEVSHFGNCESENSDVVAESTFPGVCTALAGLRVPGAAVVKGSVSVAEVVALEEEADVFAGEGGGGNSG